MNKVRIIVLATAIAAISMLSVANAATGKPMPSNEEIVKMGRSFEIRSGESLLLAHHRKPSAYRICVEDVPGVVPLKVDVDGKFVEVLDGSCADVVGSHISAKPSERLPPDDELVGHFEWVKK